MNLRAFIFILALTSGASCVKFFNSTSELPANMTSECKDALTADIACTRLITPSDALSRLEHNTTHLADHCSSTCLDSLAAWSADVTTCCGDTPHDFGFSTLLGGQPVLRSAPDLAASLLWARNLTCLRDRNTSSFCSPSLTNGTFAPCADCTLQYLSTLLSSWYGSARAPDREDFETHVNSTCCLPLDAYPILNWTSPSLPPAPEQPNITCFSGCLYTVSEGDTCASIARSQGVAYDRFVYQNGLDWECRHPLTPGTELCIGRSCTLYEVQEGDTCASVLESCGGNFTLTELIAWNPAIHGNCDNLGWLKGKDICVSPPGAAGGNYEVNTTVGWGVEWTTPGWGEWGAAPTAGEDWVDVVATTTGAAVPMVTMLWNATAERVVARMVEENCPVGEEVWEGGRLSRECRRLLAPYCDPHPDAPMPPRPERGFPMECVSGTAGR
ncbi:hypothetical protein QBC34DRAFT_444120 [Podospora aff. communis PSN243]|uniref:LysM domain-containing protein n=1 Tax=Podospora aff. communis PSN243 TaxID=3040156 RepID=A0AAV9G431_9PEZI|nr:hypothetical protein QBC34DRAFT_444120 [Podospora aff. communis PSN243]